MVTFKKVYYTLARNTTENQVWLVRNVHKIT